jgi:hypothetical protein
MEGLKMQKIQEENTGNTIRNTGRPTYPNGKKAAFHKKNIVGRRISR